MHVSAKAEALLAKESMKRNEDLIMRDTAS